MKQKWNSLVIFFLMMGLSLSSYGEVITLDQFLKTYLENSANLRQEYQTLNKSKAGVEKSEAIDDIRLKLSGGYTQKKDYQLGFSTYDTTDIFQAQGGVEKVFSATGTRLSVIHSLSKLKAKDGSLYVPPSTYLTPSDYSGYTPALTFSVIQPVLKNFFGMQDRFAYDYSLLGAKIQQVQYAEALEKAMIDGVSSYLDWLYLTQQRKILKSIIASNMTVLRDTEARVKAGIAEVADLEVARETVIVYENSLLEVENAYHSLILKIQKSVPLTDKDLPQEEFLSQNRKLDEKSVDSIRSLQILALMQKQMEMVLGIKKNSLLPDLNLILSYTLSGTKESLGSAYGDMQRSEMFFGFELSVPFWNSQAGGELKESQADYLKFMEQKKDSEKEIFNSEKVLKNSFKTYSELILSQKKYIESLEKKARDEDKQYRQGMLSLREIARTSTDLANARLTLTQYIASYHLYYYQYLGLVDEITEQYSSCIPEFFKTEK